MPPKKATKTKAAAKDKGKKVVEEPAAKRSKRNHVVVKDEGDEDQIEDSGENESNWTPKNWPGSYENVKKMMEGVVAPVDSLPWFKSCDPKETKPVDRFRILVALILSARTKDEPLIKVWNSLCDKGLSIDWVLKTAENELVDLIKSTVFYKQKATQLKKTAAILKEKYDGDIPDTLKELTELPGVGIKTAVLYLQCCHGRAEGIGPDGHIVRVVNRLVWVPKPVNCHTRTRNQLEEWLPKKTMLEFNRLVSRFGSAICNDAPKCSECLNKNICPGSKKVKK